jgi:hypothetical protein
MDFELLSRLALAFGIGLLFGLESGWRRRGPSRAAAQPVFALLEFPACWAASSAPSPALMFGGVVAIVAALMALGSFLAGGLGLWLTFALFA